MIEAKDCVRPLSSCLAAFLVIGLSGLGSGCSSISGLRSIGTGWPSLRSIWDRSGPGSPLPENDLYAQGMHGMAPAPDAGEKPAAKGATAPAGEKDSASPGRQTAEPTDGARAAQRSGASRRSEPDDGIRVTLGRPEPLPGLLADTRPQAVASAGGPPQWKAEDAKGDRDSVAVARAPIERRAQHEAGRADVARPATSPSDAQPAADILLAAAGAKLDKLKTYQVSITRQERVEGQLQPPEKILLSVRRDPRAVRLEWTDGPSKGREVIYSSSLDPHTLFVHQPGAALVLPSVKIPVDSPLIMKSSRHKITEAGFETILENLRKAQRDTTEEGPDGADLEYKGVETPGGIDQPCHHFVEHSATGQTWNVYLDSRSMLPRLLLAEDSRGELLERYVYRDVRENPAELVSAASFEPDKRWGDSKGLLSRLARAAAGATPPSTGESTRR
jgi:hypothetical protein